MKRKGTKYYLTFTLIWATCVQMVQAQPKVTTVQAKQLAEKTTLFTDRETYAVDEDILFSAFNVSPPAIRNAEWSNILYVELVAPNGESFIRRKYAFSQDATSGALRIPTGLLTGNYYLRAYSRWMRDYSPSSYFYKRITVINPFRAELLEPGENSGNTTGFESPVINSPDFRIKTTKKSYRKQEQVGVEVSVLNSEDFAVKFVVSVIPKGTESEFIPKLSGSDEQKFSPDFIPETRGLSISGKVVNAADSVPMPFTLVGLTIFKENPENQNVSTNEKGQFFFDLSKLRGEYEIFISAKSNEKQTPLILVDNDFSTQNIKLPYVQLDLSKESKKRYQSLTFNSQIQTLFRHQKIEKELKSFSSDSTFYGKPDFVLKINNYVAMPNVKDYIYELMPQLGVRHNGKKTSLKILGIYSELAIHDPLVLVDMVSIFDIDRVLDLQPDKIDRIELITMPYVRGDIVFGGIVSFFSKKGNLAGIDLTSAGRFITYNMLSRDFIQDASDKPNQHVPDRRNCLYWNHDLKLKENESSGISFTTGDNAGDYVIIIRGMDKTGKTKIATAEIRIE